MKTIIALLVAAASGSLFAEPLDFKGVPFGASEATFKASHPTYNCVPFRAGPAERMCMGGVDVCRRDRHGCGRADFDASTFAGETVNWISAMFKDDRLVEVVISTSPSTFSAIASGLRQKFGQPMRVRSEPFNTVGGAKATNEKLDWRSADFVVEAARYDDLLTRGMVRLTTPEWEAEAAKASGAKDKARTGNM